jgi:hypothetical protein
MHETYSTHDNNVFTPEYVYAFDEFDQRTSCRRLPCHVGSPVKCTDWK